MVDPAVPVLNPFQETMLGLELSQWPEGRADLFSRACVEQYQSADMSRFGYLFAQVFEPNVLVEVALLAGVPYEEVAGLRYRPTPTIAHLAERTAHAGDLTVVELVNVAAALISISRFGAATDLLEAATARAAGPLQTFEAWMLVFVVANRCDDSQGTTRAFARMRAAIETGKIPPDRTLDACAQAVVWYMKRREPMEADYQWYLATGQSVADQRERVDPGSISAWYRAVAMVPAAAGDAERTRQFMVYAREAAERAVSLRPRAYERHFEKTYHESSLKEHMYVTRDPDRAEAAGRALIAMDTAWGLSYAELGEAYAFFGRTREAAEMYRRAVAAGPPYYGYHLLQAARWCEKAGMAEESLDHYLTLSHLVPDNVGVLSAGLDLARAMSHPSSATFAHMLDQLTHRTLDG
jgi:tetratricopeptide (TPR) repeat protein